MKSRKFGVIGVLIVAGVCLMAVGHMQGARKTGYFSEGEFRFDENEKQSISDHKLQPFKNIDIEVASADTELIDSDFYGIDIVNNNNTKINWEISNDELRVYQRDEGKSKWFNFNFNLDFFGGGSNNESYVKVYCPKSAAINSLTTDTLSGDISISQHDIQDLEVNVASGTIDLTDCSIKNGHFSPLSGEITTRGIVSEGLSIDNASGGIELDGTFNGVTKIDSLSGDITINTTNREEDYNMNFSMLSGDVKINGTDIEGMEISRNNGAPHDISIDTASGDIDLWFTK